MRWIAGARLHDALRRLRLRVTGLAALMLVALFANADEAAVRKMVDEKMRDHGRIEEVKKAPWGNLFEVVFRSSEGLRVYYVDAAATVIIAGQAYDAKSGRNITQERLRKLTAISFESLPLESAITTVRGNGRRKIAVFSDPNCPYCKRFEKTLARIDDLTIHVFLYPVIKPESVVLTKSVWCSSNRAKAWNDMMLRDIEPAPKTDCDTPIDALLALGRKLGASSTPTWFLQDGTRHQGAMPPEEIARLLEEASLAVK